MRLASKVRMNLSDRRNNNPWEHPGNDPNSATVYPGSIHSLCASPVSPH